MQGSVSVAICVYTLSGVCAIHLSIVATADVGEAGGEALGGAGEAGEVSADVSVDCPGRHDEGRACDEWMDVLRRTGCCSKRRKVW